jgi:hypothetical protein
MTMNAKVSAPISQWRCRVCDFDRYYRITVIRKNGARYETSFYACSQCSTMFFNPHQFNKHSTENPNIEMPNLVRLPTRR